MTMTKPSAAVCALGEELTRRALDHVLAGTTDMAGEVLRVPLGYYRDPDVLGMVVGRDEIGVQHLIRTLAADLDITLS